MMPWSAVAEAGNIRALALFGLAPDVTAMGTIILLLLMPRILRWPLLLIPLAWCAFSSAILWGLSLQWALLVPLAGLATGTVALFAGIDRSAAS
jgi:hypothetical protein